MTCREFIDFLIDYVSEDLPAGQRRVFEEHLAACPPCLDYLHTYQETIRLGKLACGGDDVPQDVPEELVRAILEARRR